MKKWFSDNKVFLQAFCFGMAVLLLIFCFPVKSHAAGVNFDDWVVPVTADFAQGLQVRENIWAVQTDAGHTTVAFNVGDQFVFCTTLEGGRGEFQIAYSYGGSGWWTCDTSYETIWYTAKTPWFEPYPPGLAPSFSTLEEGLQAAQAYLTGSGGGDESPTRFVFDYDLPPGNILYIRKGIDSDEWDSDLTLTAEFPLQSDIGSDHFVRSFYVGDAASLPSSETVFPDDLGNLISEVYLGVGEPKTALGQSRYGYLHSSEAASIYPYLVIYNPVRTGVYDTMSSTEQNMYANVNLHVHLEAAAAAYAWPLTSNFTIAGGVTGTTTQDPAESEFQITYDTETQTWDTLDPEGDPGTLIPGGNTIIDSSSTSIKGLLQDFLGKFTRIFEKSYDAISGLINAGGAFIAKLGGIFAWLPSPVYSVLSSALLLVVVIGTLKVLL